MGVVTDQFPITAKHKITHHINCVRVILNEVIAEMWSRYNQHDKTKLAEPEYQYYQDHIHKLPKMEYGSPDYYATMMEMLPALRHHYQHNRHHPEHHLEGISGMTLVDLAEMLADWMVAAAQNNLNGSFRQSLEKNSERFLISQQLKDVLANTERWLSGFDGIKAIVSNNGSRYGTEAAQKREEKLSNC